MSLFVCSKCGCIDNTATSYYWALIRPCKNRIYDKSLKGYCIIQLSEDSKDLSKSFFDVYDKDEMKMIYAINISILKEMFVI